MYFRSYLRAPPYFFHLPVRAIVVRRSEWRSGSLTPAPLLVSVGIRHVKTKKSRAQGGVTTDSTAWKKTKASQPLTLLFSMPLKDLIVWYQSRWRNKCVRVAKRIYPRRNTSSLVGRRVTNVWRSTAIKWEKNVGKRGALRSRTLITTVTRSSRLLELIIRRDVVVYNKFLLFTCWAHLLTFAFDTFGGTLAFNPDPFLVESCEVIAYLGPSRLKQ